MSVEATRTTQATALINERLIEKEGLYDSLKMDSLHELISKCISNTPSTKVEKKDSSDKYKLLVEDTRELDIQKLFNKICKEGNLTEKAEAVWMKGITKAQRDVIIKNLAETHLPLRQTWAEELAEKQRNAALLELAMQF